MRRLSHHSALITPATMAATTRLNLTRRGSLDTKGSFGGVRPHMIAGNTCAASQTRRNPRGGAVAITKAASISMSARGLVAGVGRACWGEVPHGVAIVRDRSVLTARNLLIDRGLRGLPDGNRSCNFESAG